MSKLASKCCEAKLAWGVSRIAEDIITREDVAVLCEAEEKEEGEA